MIQVEEIINLVISSIFIIYLVFLIRWRAASLLTFWFGGIVLIYVSQIFTIAEGFYFPVIFNIIEHFFFTTAVLFFLISIIKKEFY